MSDLLKPRPKPPPAPGSIKPRQCRCENPQTYRDMDGEMRCLCGCAAPKRKKR